MSYRDVKTVRSVADAYRSMYVKPNEDILNEELIDALIEDVREEEKNLQEGTWAIPDSYKKLYNLQVAFLQMPSKANPANAKRMAKQIYPLFGDDSFFDDLLRVELGKDGAEKDDLRNLIVKHLEPWGLKFKKGSKYQITHAPKSWLDNMTSNPAESVDESAKKRMSSKFRVKKLPSIKFSFDKDKIDERVSGDDTPMSMMVHSKDLDVFKKLKVIASKAGVKLAKELKGIKVTGPVKSLIRFTELMSKEPSFKKEAMGFPHIEINESVKYDENILKSVKDIYASLEKFGIEGGIVEDIDEAFSKKPKSGAEVAKMMMKNKAMKGFANKVKKMKTVTAVQLDKMLPDYVSGGDIHAMFEKVKDGKLDPLSKMGKSKLTGAEIQKYYRDNPKQKAAARDKSVKKAIELALDLSGATNYAIKEIEKIKRGLSKLPAVKLAIQHANEEKEFTGHHVVIEALSSTDMIKLKAYGKMLAKITKLPFDEKTPEKSIDKLMGQIWKQKHNPSNWERLHKMVGMMKSIGVKMPSLKGKYMGLDPVTKKAIFYTEDTNELIEWHQKIEDIKEDIEEIVEAQEMKDADVKKIAQMTDRNDHNGSLMHLAKLLGDRKAGEALKGIMQTHKALGHMPKGLIDTRMAIFDDLMKQSKKKYRNHSDIYNAL